MTTRAIKEGQYNPSAIEKVAVNRWRVKSRSSDFTYTITRHKNKWTCDCPAVSPTCYHVTSVLMNELAEVGWVGAVWTSEAEAKRQRRKTWALTRNGRPFWVTGKVASWVRRLPGKRARFWKAEKDKWSSTTDCYWFVQGRPARVGMKGAS